MVSDRSFGRRRYLAAVGSVSAVTLAGCAGGGTETIVPGTAPGFAPFEFKDEETNELVGFDIALVEEVLSRTDYEQGDWVEIEFNQLQQSLLNGDIDLIAAALSITEDREEAVDFSDPYYEANQAVVVRSGAGFSPTAIEDLADRRVGAQSGTTGEDEIESGLIDPGLIEEGQYRSYDNYNLAIEDLVNGNIDAVVVDRPTAFTFAADRPVEISFVIDTGEVYGLAMRPDDDRLPDINDALASVREDGTYDDLIAEWIESG
jgi:polar amino acid transport system substrate-binding protein